MSKHLKEYYEEIRSFCPKLSEEEAIEAGDALLQIAKLLSDTVQETPELKTLLETGKENDIK
ncbi:hypothetical protein [Phascolarctobacterium succinatutens]|uniref:hypothetical protein n=1 Tax=Phascolarctobacterium succinatutens TaxID=626940 RepID=UPI003A93789A